MVIHAQDFCNWYNNELCVELFEIEKMLTDEQQSKTIFVHWDHDLINRYQGRIHCVEFPSHSWELIEDLKKRFNDFR